MRAQNVALEPALVPVNVDQIVVARCTANHKRVVTGVAEFEITDVERVVLLQCSAVENNCAQRTSGLASFEDAPTAYGFERNVVFIFKGDPSDLSCTMLARSKMLAGMPIEDRDEFFAAASDVSVMRSIIAEN